MKTNNKTVLVTGATGQQGGAVATALLNSGYTVRGLTRNAKSEKAEALSERGVEIVEGNFSHLDSLTRAVRGADAVFFMTTPFEEGTDVETQQGLAMIEAIKNAGGVEHVVYSSVASANQATGIPHFDSKFEVENVLKASGLKYTIVAPVYFMDNARVPQSVEGIQNGVFAVGVPEGKPLQQIAVSDIGAFVAAVFDRGEAVYGQRYDIAGDEQTGEGYASELAESLGHDISFMALAPEAYSAWGEDMVIMTRWFGTHGYDVRIPELKSQFPEVKWKGFKAWASEQSWN